MHLQLDLGIAQEVILQVAELVADFSVFYWYEPEAPWPSKEIWMITRKARALVYSLIQETVRIRPFF